MILRHYHLQPDVCGCVCVCVPCVALSLRLPEFCICIWLKQHAAICPSNRSSAAVAECRSRGAPQSWSMAESQQPFAGNMIAAMAWRVKYRLMDRDARPIKLTLPIQSLGVHPKNRGGVYPAGVRVRSLCQEACVQLGSGSGSASCRRSDNTCIGIEDE